IATIRSECEQMKNLEGEVRQNVLDSRKRLGKLKNDKIMMIAELINYMQQRMELLEKVETKIGEKQAYIRQMEESYEEGKENLSSAMTSTDLDTSETANATMYVP
ncbi:hypothetical protein PMAYCL1PPCAC_10507, partial [Pristionchus mayeri]